MVNPSRGPYNMPPADRRVDDLTYNPQGDARPDAADFDEYTDPSSQPVGARGADNQPTFRDFNREDKETVRSDETGVIPKGEVDDLLGSVNDDEMNVQGRTRGNKVDAWQQERNLDQALDDAGVSSAQQDIEIGAATGRR